MSRSIDHVIVGSAKSDKYYVNEQGTLRNERNPYFAKGTKNQKIAQDSI